MRIDDESRLLAKCVVDLYTNDHSPYRIDTLPHCLCRINPIAPLRTHRRHCSMALLRHQYHRHHRHLLRSIEMLI